MQDTWIDKPDSVIRDDIISIAKNNTGLSNFKSTGVLRGVIEVFSQVVFFIYKTAINPVYSNASLDGATGLFLSFRGLELGVVRKTDAKAKGHFTGHSYGEGNVPAGSWIVVDGRGTSSAELRYKVTAKTVFTANSDFSIPVEAEFAGSDYNIGEGMPLRITRVVAGLDSINVPEAWQSALGENTESDASYRERIKNRCETSFAEKSNAGRHKRDLQILC